MERPSLDQLFNPTGSPQKTGASAFSASTSPVNTSERPSLDQLFSPEKYPTNTPTQNVSTTSEPTSIMQDIGTSAKKTFIDPFTSRFGNIDYNNQGIASNVLQSVGAIAGGVTDLFGTGLVEAGKLVLPKQAEDVIGGVASKTGEVLSSAVPDSLKSWAEAHPEAAANLGSIVDIASIVPLGKAVGAAKTALKVGDEAGVLAKAETAAQRIAQPSKPELFNAKNAVDAILSIDTNGIKTYSGLKTPLQAQNNIDLAKVTSELLKDTTKYGIESFEITKSGIKFNPVKDAMTSLKELGQKTADTDLLTEIRPFEIKLAKREMVQNDVNELSKIIGRKQNAFKQSGELLKGTNAIKAENTRRALKDIARTDIPEEVANLDKSVSDRINLVNRMDNISNAVGREMQRAENLNILQKGIRFSAKTADLLSGRVVSTILNQLKSSSRLSAVEIEKELVKNLKKIQEINRLKDANKMQEYLKSIGYFTASQSANNLVEPKESPK